MGEVYSNRTIKVFIMLAIILFGAVELAVVYFCFPSFYTSYMLYIPLYFIILGISLLFALVRFDHKHLHPGRAIARLMILNTSQFIVSVALLSLYVYEIDVQRDAFLLMFGIFYIWFMVIKTVVLYNIDHRFKVEKQRLKNEGKK